MSIHSPQQRARQMVKFFLDSTGARSTIADCRGKAQRLASDDGSSGGRWKRISEDLEVANFALESIVSEPLEEIGFDYWQQASRLGELLQNFKDSAAATLLAREFSDKRHEQDDAILDHIERAKEAVVRPQLRAALFQFATDYAHKLKEETNSASEMYRLSGESLKRRGQRLLTGPLAKLAMDIDTCVYLNPIGNEVPVLAMKSLLSEMAQLFSSNSSTHPSGQFFSKAAMAFSNDVEPLVAKLRLCRAFAAPKPARSP